MRNRSVVFVVRNRKILMEKLCYDGRVFYSIPGGGIEDGETPEEEGFFDEILSWGDEISYPKKD